MADSKKAELLELIVFSSRSLTKTRNFNFSSLSNIFRIPNRGGRPSRDKARKRANGQVFEMAFD